ncbi:hypothetical protein AAMO2058_001497300 [Amorphochlora amoebiformis]
MASGRCLVLLTGMVAIVVCIGDDGACQREESRLVREILKNNIWPWMKGYAFPPGCGLDGEKDIFGVQEKNKKRVRRGLWECRACNKRFRAEKWIDLHMHRKHPSLLRNESAVCLGDVCHMLNCEHEGLRNGSPWGVRKCNPELINNEKVYCIKIASTCFPRQASKLSNDLHDRFIDEVCERIKCDNRGYRIQMFQTKDDKGWMALYS